MRAGGFTAMQDFFMGVDLQWLHEPKLGEPLQLAIGLCLRAFKCLMHLALAQSAPVAMADAPALPTPSPAVSGSGFEQADELPRPESLEQGETARSGREVSEVRSARNAVQAILLGGLGGGCRWHMTSPGAAVQVH